MIEVVGNLWDYPAEVRIITTNGTVKKNGEAVMGRGCAFEAKKRLRDLPLILGQLLSGDDGNRPYWFPFFTEFGGALVTFPVKHNWYEKADLELIRRSAEIVSTMRALWDCPIVMPRPGCGNGGLRWEDVKPVLEPILDDRFHVITFK